MVAPKKKATPKKAVPTKTMPNGKPLPPWMTPKKKK